MRILLLAVIAACAEPAVVTLDEPSLPLASVSVEAPTSIEELRERIQLVLDREGIPGVGIALVGRDGPIWVGGVGVAELTTRRPVDGDSVFRVGSITKSIVGLGAMRLAEQGKLSLDRPLDELVPDTGIVNRWQTPVTLAQCLEHTAGLDDIHMNELFADDDAMSPAAALAINKRARVIRWEPGTRNSYSNVGYTLAARAIEVASGEPFDVYLKQEVLVPLGMGEADFRRTPSLAARLATGYSDRGRVAEFRPIPHRGAGALLASATDLAKLVQFWLVRDTRVVSAAGLERIEHARTLPYRSTDLEYGLGNYGDVSQPARGRGHDGGIDGFLSSLRYFPDLGVGYVMLLNGTHSLRAFIEIRSLLFAYLARGKAVAQPPVGVSQPPGAEFFAFASPRNQVSAFIDTTLSGWRVHARGDEVHVDPLLGSHSVDLVATADGGYRLPWESGTSVRFAHDRDGKPIMIVGLLYAEAASWWPARLRALAIVASMILLQLAPLLLGVKLGLAAIRRGRLLAPGLTAWPAIAGLCVVALPRLFEAAGERQVFGERNALTIAICATTWLFAFAASISLWATVRWTFSRERPAFGDRLLPTMCAIAAVVIAVWAHSWIGLRTWAY
ncbi:MAG: beta-lactamase family protein [Kofleriaceae bacterium]|nr:beta-lactamase family protein [Kofleriaceae bacterium]